MQKGSRRKNAAELRSSGLVIWTCRHGLIYAYVLLVLLRLHVCTSSVLGTISTDSRDLAVISVVSHDFCVLHTVVGYCAQSFCVVCRIVDMIMAAGEKYGVFVLNAGVGNALHVLAQS